MIESAGTSSPLSPDGNESAINTSGRKLETTVAASDMFKCFQSSTSINFSRVLTQEGILTLAKPSCQITLGASDGVRKRNSASGTRRRNSRATASSRATCPSPTPLIALSKNFIALPSHSSSLQFWQRAVWHGFRVRRCAAKIAIAPDGEVVGEVADVLAGDGGEQRAVSKIVARAEDERTVAAVGRGSGALVGEDIFDIAVAAVDPVVAGFAGIGVAEELRRDGAQQGFVLELVEFVGSILKSPPMMTGSRAALPEMRAAKSRIWPNCFRFAALCSGCQPNWA